MQHIQVYYSSLNYHDFDRSSIENIVNSALDRYLGVVKSVEVRLRDVNGPKGGIDKLVTLRVHTANKEHVIKSKGNNFMQATYSACRRAKRAVGRYIDRRNSYDY